MDRKELSQKLGISESTLAAYEQGVREPNIERLIEISNIFCVSIDHLVGNDGKKMI
jgi:transcriptional regulator with XRE-family HTH domain